MKHAVFAALICFAPVSLAAEEVAPEEGPSLMERGAQLFLEGLLNEMEPALEDLQSFGEQIGPGMAELWAQMGPAFAELMEKVDDVSNYEPPVMLPNGDIIIRRKSEAPELDGPVDI